MDIPGLRGMFARGAVPVLAGLVIQAGTTYAFLVLAGRVLGPVGFGALSGLYLLLTSVATGLFVPVEQEVARRRGAERPTGNRDPSLYPRAVGHAMAYSAVAVAVALIALPWTLQLLGDEPWLLVALCVGLPGYGLWFATRGELSGHGQLQRYGVQLALDGGLRLLGGVALALAGVQETAAFGLVFAAGPWLALALTSMGRRRPPSTAHEQRTSGLTRAVSLLVVSALAAQLLINAGPLLVSLLATSADRGTAGVYLAALVVIRVPVFLFTAVQPSLLPALAERAVDLRPDRFRRLLGMVLLAVLVIGGLMCVLATAFGPPVVSWLFGFEERLGRTTFLLVTLAVSLFLLSTVLGQGLVGLGRHGWVTAGWALGLVGLAAGTAAGGDAVTRATSGLLAGSVVATLVLAGVLAAELARWPAHQPATPVTPAGFPAEPV